MMVAISPEQRPSARVCPCMGSARPPKGYRRRQVSAALPLFVFLTLTAASLPANGSGREAPAGPAFPAFTPVKLGAASGVTKIVAGRAAALLYVPAGYRGNEPLPLLVMLHGAGGTSRGALDLVKSHADALGILVLAPKSRAETWDIIADGRLGPDEAALDALVRQASVDYAVDQRRIAIGGFSDGASYALAIGLARADRFSDILAFSPGFAAVGAVAGTPAIFISHGTADRVLPIEACSRRIVPRLRRAGYGVRYEEFEGGHKVPAALAREALEAFVRRVEPRRKVAA